MKKRRVFLLGLVFLLTVSLISGCVTIKKGGTPEVEPENTKIVQADEFGIISEDEHVTFVDGRDEEVKISKKPEKVVILFGSFLELWIRNGGELVGMVEPSEEDMMPELEGVKSVGKRGSISLEEVIALGPDLVILSSNTGSQLDMIPSIKGTGAEVIALDYSFKNDFFKISKLFATINDEVDLYTAKAETIKNEIQKTLGKVPEKDNPTAIIIMSTKSKISVRTANTTIGEMFKDLKVINIADLSNSKEATLDFSLEKILEEDPDFIFVQTIGSDVEAVKEKLKADVESNPAWSSLSAVKNGKYIILDKDLYTYKANYRYKEAYENLAKILYPEIFN